MGPNPIRVTKLLIWPFWPFIVRNEIIYIVRYGQIDWNNSGRYGGQIDVDLNKTGIEQALQYKIDK